MIVQDVIRGFLDALYPPICHLCGRLSDGKYPHCCPDCFDSFELVGPSFCELCGEPFTPGQAPHLCIVCIKKRQPFKWCRGVFLYSGNIAEAISGFKYKGQVSLQNPLEDALLKGLKAVSPVPEAELLIPVPLSGSGIRRRGFNQSYLLAGAAAREMGIEVQTNVLSRRGSRTQVGLSARERMQNAGASFVPGRAVARVKGQSVLLFDDVYTTGATVRACARILRKAGAEVSVLTFARAGKNGMGVWG